MDANIKDMFAEHLELNCQVEIASKEYCELIETIEKEIQQANFDFFLELQKYMDNIIRLEMFGELQTTLTSINRLSAFSKTVSKIEAVFEDLPVARIPSLADNFNYVEKDEDANEKY
jgi:hypothetical protein